MATSFNLLNEPFIICRVGAGTTPHSLVETLRDAHALDAIEDASPLTTLALHRFLLAILHRALNGPETKGDWRDVWDTGRISMDLIAPYLEKHSARFDLFDAKQPFFQDAAFTAKAKNGINQLVRELSRGNNATLFDHTHEEPPPVLTSAEAARAIITEQMFAVGGGKSELGYTSSGPAASGVMALILGANLFETLMLNLLSYPPQAFPKSKNDDAPAWERSTRPTADRNTPDGYCDFLTWQSRSIRLLPESDGRVQWMYYAAGRSFKGANHDTMTTYIRAEDDKVGDRPVRLSEGKDLWRESASLFEFSEAEKMPPATLHWLKLLKSDGYLPEDRTYRIAVFGLSTDKAKVNFWRRETLPMPLEYLTNADVVAALKSAIERAGEVGAVLRNSAASFADAALTARVDNRSPDKNRLWQMVDAVGADALYWSRLEPLFLEFMRKLPQTDTSDYRAECVYNWFETIQQQAMNAYREAIHEARFATDRDRRAIIAGEDSLRRALGKLRKTYGKPKEVTT